MVGETITNATVDKAKSGYKKTKLGWIPNEWGFEALDKRIDLLSGYAFPSDGYSEQGVRLLRGANVKRGNTDWKDDITKYWDKGTNNLERYQLQEGDLVIAMDGSLVGRSYARLTAEDLPALLLQRVARIRSEKVDVGFLTLLISSQYFVSYCDAVKTVTAIPHISAKDIRKFRIPLPALPEQQKIATILSTWDKAIDILQKLIDKKQERKKGLMQQLLSGKKRFDGFADEWREVKLKEIATIQGRVGWKGYTKEDLRKEGPLALGAKHIDKLNKLDLSDPTYLSIEKYMESPEIMVVLNDIIIVQRGTLGKVVLIEKEIGEATINPSMAIIRVNNNLIEPQFLYVQICGEQVQRIISSEASSTGVPMISQKQIGTFAIRVPSIAEQQKIASILSAADEEIKKLQTQLTKLQEQKKGLIQKLLTGEVRVKI